jgi:hypothetical protein
MSAPCDTEADAQPANVIQADVPTRVVWVHWNLIQRNFNPSSVEHSLSMLQWFVLYSPHEDCKRLAAAMLKRHEFNMQKAMRKFQ